MVLYGFGGGDGLETALARADALLRGFAGATGVRTAHLSG
jgi:hypothetical protein